MIFLQVISRNPEIFQHQSQADLTIVLKVQPSSSAADSETVAGLPQEYLETIPTLYLYFLVILIEFFIVIDRFVVLKYTLYYINLCCSLSLKVKRAFCRGTYAQFFFMVWDSCN